MNKINAVLILFFSVLFLPQTVAGKLHYSQYPMLQAKSTINAGKSIEDRFRPILEHKIARSKRSRDLSGNIKNNIVTSQQPITEYDFLMLAQAWNELSPEFKSLYKKATQIPESFKVYISPGGNFEIAYTTVGEDAVDSVDLYGYSSSDWRKMENNSNGIPDYIDEVGWALDSCWVTYIERFGLVSPIISTNNRYQIIVEHQQQSDLYGLTWYNEKSDETAKGYSSFISLRNNWPSSAWKHLGYDTIPKYGIQVTCAHEFFHAIQYAMTWEITNKFGTLQLDDFPLAWIEGSAVAMEEFVFGDINDYLQYADFYFTYPGPRMSFFNGSNNVYSNSILMLYLLKKTSKDPKKNFTALMHQNNYVSPMNFKDNLNKTAQSHSYQWVKLLNDFHSSSFHTGNFADTSKFLIDAPLYSHWTYIENNANRFGSTKQVNPYAMEKFYIQPISTDNDTLWITLQTQNSSSEPWAASILLIKDTTVTHVPVVLDKNGNGHLSLYDWRSKDYALAIVTNGDPTLARGYSVWFEHSGIYYAADSTYTIYSDCKDAWVGISTKIDLRGELSVKKSTNAEIVQPDTLYRRGDLFQIEIPEIWNSYKYKNQHTSTFSINILSLNLSDAASIYFYNKSSSHWEKVTTITDTNADSVLLSTTITKSGIYGVFEPIQKKSDEIIIYPNRVSRDKKSQDSLYIKGAEITELRIYNLDGTLVFNQKTRANSSFKQLSEQSRKYLCVIPVKKFSPGIYRILILHNSSSGSEKTAMRKLIVVP